MTAQTESLIKRFVSLLRRRWPLIVLGLLASLCLFACVLLMPLQPGCPYYRRFTNKCEFTRRFPVSDLLVDEAFFPGDVDIAPPYEPRRHGTLERVRVTIYDAEGELLGAHEIDRWARASIAERNYRRDGEIADVLPAPPCDIADNIGYESLIADQFCAACSVGGYCKAVGLYQDYVSTFEMTINTGLTEADFLAVITAIDQRFAEYLEP
jgi:hypothetical protein